MTRPSLMMTMGSVTSSSSPSPSCSAVGGCWAVMTIAVPVFLPMGAAAGVSAPLMIAAVMSGITLGYSLCFYADAVLMTTAGSGVSNITTIKATTPYAIGVAAVSAVGLLLCGLV